jgi:hypothetical protein
MCRLAAFTRTCALQSVQSVLDVNIRPEWEECGDVCPVRANFMKLVR